MGDNYDGENGSVLGSVIREVFNQKNKMKDEDDYDYLPFADIDKSTVLQGCRAFHEQNVVRQQPERVCDLLTKLLYLLAQGERFTPTEASDIFFGVTQLFQSQHPAMRRLMYLFIKEVATATDSGEIIIVTASLQKDMVSSKDLLRANSLRVLCKICDNAMLAQVDRSIKPLVVDRNPMVSSAALVAGHLFLDENPEIIRRWVGEVQEALLSDSDMVQYHALALMYRIRSQDRLAATKLVSSHWHGSNRLSSPLALCQLVRYTLNMLLQENIPAETSRNAFTFLQSCLRHRSDMVIFEAARAIIALPGISPAELGPAVNQLQLFLGSSKPVLRFAAVRILNRVAMAHPDVVMGCNDDMEALISDSNRSIATLAITTLLKTGREEGVERLLKQISHFMTEISDEFKVVVVNAIQQLCLRYPRKSTVLLQFMHNCLREEGGFPFKQAVVNTVLALIEKLPECKMAGLNALGEFIEDCEFPMLSVQVLHVLGKEAPSTPVPGQFIRYMFNRVILEVPRVRAAAVSAMAKVAASVESLRPEIMVLLRRSQMDDDDEVRDRATMYIGILEAEGAGGAAETGTATTDEMRKGSLELVTEGLPPGVSVRALETAVQAYSLRPADGELTLDTLPIVKSDGATGGEIGYEAEVKQDRGGILGLGGLDEDTAEDTEAQKAAAEAAAASTNYAAELYQIPAFAALGQLQKSSAPFALTEEESEYGVSVIKHTFAGHMVFQFIISNTIDDQVLRQAQMELEFEDEEAWEIVHSIKAKDVSYSARESTYICAKPVPEAGLGAFATMGVKCELQFFACECDPTTGELLDEEDEGMDDQYPVEDMEIGPSDFMVRSSVSNFRSAWAEMNDCDEMVETFDLGSFESIEAATLAIIDSVGLFPCDGTAAVAPQAKKHMLLLAGTFSQGGHRVLARASLALSANQASSSVRMKIGVRCAVEDVSELVISCIS